MLVSADKLYNLIETNGGDYAVSSLDEAYTFCEKIALGHYENFPVGSLFIPKRKRKYVFAVYAFARIADDIADELDAEKSERLGMLASYKEILINKVHSTHPIFWALSDMQNKLEIPDSPFLKLITAFSMDVNFRQPENFDELFDYCRHSANPVGELILRIFDIYNDKTVYYSDKICTALQLVNFWQDFSLDLKRNRVYIPKTVISKYKIDIKEIFELSTDTKIEKMLEELYDKTQSLFDEGKSLVNYLKPYRLKLEIAATINGGECILKKTKDMGNKIFIERPRLYKYDLFKIMLSALTV